MSDPCKILIVDDEPIVCERLQALLEIDGHRVKTIVDPVEAIRCLGNQHFDIVISDIRMGEIDGLQIMEKVLQQPGHPRVILITGYATIELAREALTKGAFDFIAKPFKVQSQGDTQHNQKCPGIPGTRAAAGGQRRENLEMYNHQDIFRLPP